MLPTEVKPIKCPVTEKNKTKTSKSKENNNNNNNMNKNEGRKAASGGEDAKSKSYSATSFADFCIWNGSQSAWFINRMLGSFGSL